MKLNKLAFNIRNPTDTSENKTSTKVRFSSKEICYKLFIRNTQTGNKWCSVEEKIKDFPKDIEKEFKNIKPETLFCVIEPEYFFKIYRKITKQILQKSSE